MTIGSVAFRREIYERDGALCGLCGSRVEWEVLHLDHIVPESAGGQATADNLQVAHARCNRRAGAKLIRKTRQRFLISLPHDLAQQVRALAAEGQRPLNSQFQMLVEERLAAREQLVAA